MAIGITFSIVSQAMTNMLVASGIGPVTGQTLPMISYGGTSIFFVCISLGILQSIARGNEQAKPVENEPEDSIEQPIETKGVLA
jgi:cell division protein FtsW